MYIGISCDVIILLFGHLLRSGSDCFVRQQHQVIMEYGAEENERGPGMCLKINISATLENRTQIFPCQILISVTIRTDPDKSLARPTSRRRRTESIVSLESGVCSCAELQVFSCYRG